MARDENVDSNSQGPGNPDSVIADAADLYQEDIRIDFEAELENMVVDLWGSPRNVDWNQEMEATGTERQVLIDLSTQFHYNNMAELSLCGTILENEHLLEAKMVSSIIAVSKIRNIGTWSKYLSMLQVAASVPAPEKEYFNRLYEIDNTVDLLLGMSVVGKVTWMALADELHDFGDPVFQSILDQVAEQKEAKLRFTKDYLQKAVSEMDEEEMQRIEENARHFRGHARETILYHRDTLEKLDKDTIKIANHVEREITGFYDDIGLHI